MQNIISRSQITLVEPQGHINAANAVEFKEQLTRAISLADTRYVLVDLQQAKSLDSAGLMVLVSGLSLAQSQHRKFSLCSVSPPIKIIFELTQLDKVFEIFENRDAFQASLIG